MKINEKAKSKSQQRFFGMIAAYKDGKLDTKGLKPEYLKKIKKTAADMSTQDVDDFAKTKHDKLPEKKKDNGVSKQVYPDKKENKIIRFEDFTLNEKRLNVVDVLKTRMNDYDNKRIENSRMNKAEKLAHKYAKTHGSYVVARRHFLHNVVNSPYATDVSNSFIDDFWSELKKIYRYGN